MSHLQLPSEALDLLADLLHRRFPAPDVPALPAGSRTALALEQARQAWSSTHHAGGEALHGQLAELHEFTARALSDDADTARCLRELMR